MSQEPLETIAGQINAQFKRGADSVVSASQRMVVLRERFDAECRTETWSAFCRAHMPNLSVRRVNQLLFIGRQPDPVQFILMDNEAAAERMRALRAEKREQKRIADGKNVLPASAPADRSEQRAINDVKAGFLALSLVNRKELLKWFRANLETGT